MSKNRLFIFEWEKCIDGYIIEPHSQRLISSKAKPRIKTILSDQDYLPDKMIKPNSAQTDKYDLFDIPNCYGITKTFAELIDESENTLNEKRVMKFAHKYGQLGLLSSDKAEDLELWLKWVVHFRRIFLYISKQGKYDYATAIAFFNVPPSSVFFEPVILPEEIGTGSTLLSKNKSNFHIKPNNLISAMYLVLADQISNGASFQKCANINCITWFHQNKRKKYCGSSCKQAEYREKCNSQA